MDNEVKVAEIIAKACRMYVDEPIDKVRFLGAANEIIQMLKEQNQAQQKLSK